MVNIITGYTVNKESFAGPSFCCVHSNYFTLHWTGTVVFHGIIIRFKCLFYNVSHMCVCIISHCICSGFIAILASSHHGQDSF